jgi:DUF971 family protein
VSDDPRFQPVNVHAFPNGELGIVWADGHESYYPGRMLRLACHCAACVDEMTGEKILRTEAVADAVSVVQVHPVGRYGVAIRFSDRHDTGIYTYDRLRRLCPCGKCG